MQHQFKSDLATEDVLAVALEAEEVETLRAKYRSAIDAAMGKGTAKDLDPLNVSEVPTGIKVASFKVSSSVFI